MREVLAFLASAALGTAVLADDFEALTLAVLKETRAPKAVATPALTLAQLAAAPKPLGEAPQSALLVVKTDAGNWCKLRVRLGGRKDAKGAAVPAVLLERFATFSADPKQGALADRKDVLLFPGFGIDLDSGQIVPENLGADLRFAAAVGKAPDGPAEKAMAGMPGPAGAGLAAGTLSSANGATLMLVQAPLLPPAAAAVQEGYAGTFLLDAAGRWKGTLTLKTGAPGKLIGTFRSADTQAEHAVEGELKRPGKRALLHVRFPRADLELEGHLWPSGERFAGTARLQDQEFGFVATRTP